MHLKFENQPCMIAQKPPKNPTKPKTPMKACPVVYLGFRGQISASASKLSKLVKKSFHKEELLLLMLTWKLWKVGVCYCMYFVILLT